MRTAQISLSPTVITIDAEKPQQMITAKQKTESIMVFLVTADASIEITLEDGATMDALVLQTADSDASIKIDQKSILKANATMRWHNVSLGGKNLTNDLRSEIIGENAESTINWIFFARGDENYKLSVRNVFDAPNGRGEITMKGVAEDHAQTKADGMIEIGLNGGGTNTYLTENMLMLDNTARVDAIPGLEIKTNDVKASHSATVTKVSKEDLFYFGSRGIDEKQARKMFIEGFLGELARMIPGEEWRDDVLEKIRNKHTQA